MKRIAIAIVVGSVMLLAACRKDVTPTVLAKSQGRLYACCNIHFESGEISDANYFVGKTVPFATPVKIEKVGGDEIVFTAADMKLTLHHKYGGEETLEQYFGKIFVDADPTQRVAGWPVPVRRAVTNGRVERGMTKNQVIVSLGYPPTHRTPSTEANEWIYWYNRWGTYKVVFNDRGTVADVVGRPAPTAQVPILTNERGDVVTRKAPPLKVKKKAKP